MVEPNLDRFSRPLWGEREHSRKPAADTLDDCDQREEENLEGGMTMFNTKFTYSLLSIRNMFNLSHLDVADAVTNNHVPTVCRGDENNIDSYYTNSYGLSHFKALAKKGTGGVGIQR